MQRSTLLATIDDEPCTDRVLAMLDRWTREDATVHLVSLTPEGEHRTNAKPKARR